MWWRFSSNLNEVFNGEDFGNIIGNDVFFLDSFQPIISRFFLGFLKIEYQPKNGKNSKMPKLCHVLYQIKGFDKCNLTMLVS